MDLAPHYRSRRESGFARKISRVPEQCSTDLGLRVTPVGFGRAGVSGSVTLLMSMSRPSPTVSEDPLGSTDSGVSARRDVPPHTAEGLGGSMGAPGGPTGRTSSTRFRGAAASATPSSGQSAPAGASRDVGMEGRLGVSDLQLRRRQGEGRKEGKRHRVLRPAEPRAAVARLAAAVA